MRKLNIDGIAHIIAPAIIMVAVVVGGGFFAIKSHADTSPCTHYEYGYGGSGTCVKYVQEMANGISVYYAPGHGSVTASQLTVDGQYGAQTKAKIIQIQKLYPVTADGIVGPRTWSVMCSFAQQTNGRPPTSIELQGRSAAVAAGCPKQ